MFSVRLRELREEKNYTQKDVADRTGISDSQIYRYENPQIGKQEMQPRSDAIIKLAELFNVSTDYLHGVSDERGSFYRGGLSPKEESAIAAWRKGNKLQAIMVIAGDE